MGSIQVSHLSWNLPGGRRLLDDVSFRIGHGEHAALVGANGVGKTTLLRLIAGDERPPAGTVAVDGHLAVMRQLVGTAHLPATVREALTDAAPLALRAAGAALLASERTMAARPHDADAAIAYATALGDWGERGGYELELFWDECCRAAVGASYTELADRPLPTFSGGEQKRLVLRALLYGDDDVLLLDEPDNFLDIPAKRWLEAEVRACAKTILFVSHDRELLAACATRIVTVETTGAWTHGGAFATYHAAREAHHTKQERDASLWADERERLEDIVKETRVRAKISDTFAPKLKAAESRLRQFLDAHPEPEVARDQKVTVRLGGRRTRRKAVAMERLELHGLTDPFDTELWYGDRVAVLGPNGAGKSHLLRLLAGDGSVDHAGSCRLGAGVVPGHFSQTHEHPEFTGGTLLELLEARDLVRGPAMALLRRYELTECAAQTFETLSGGQQARFQIILLELAGATLLLLDEPTDNLDLVSAEALEQGLDEFQGTVVAVTHDRWFLRGFDRFLVLDDSGRVDDLLEPPAVYRSA